MPSSRPPGRRWALWHRRDPAGGWVSLVGGVKHLSRHASGRDKLMPYRDPTASRLAAKERKRRERARARPRRASSRIAKACQVSELPVFFTRKKWPPHSDPAVFHASRAVVVPE